MSEGSIDLLSLRPARRTFERIRARDYLALTRPRVLGGVLLTVPPALALGRDGFPAAGTIASVLLGVACVGAGSSALNAWWERERDARMARTRGRPLPTGRLAPFEALAFGVVSAALGLLVLYTAAGMLAAAVAAATLAHYLGVYTLWLKPRSAWSTVVGGAAGATAPLIADAAVDGRIGPWGVVLFAIVFLWQPPHVWAIALYRRDEYAAAGFPMLPAVAGARATRGASLGFAVALVAVTLLPWLGGALGPAYAAAALAAGIFFVARIAQARAAGTPAADRRVFAASLVHLGVVFGAMLVELLVR